MSGLDRLARSQHGLLASADLRRLGFTPAHLRTMSHAGRLNRISRGVYRLPGIPQSWLQAATAATIGGSGAVLSHHSAARLLLNQVNFAGSTRAATAIEVTAKRGARRSSPGAPRYRVHTTRHLPRDHVTSRHGVACTSPLRTLADLAAVTSYDELEDYVTDFVSRELVTPASFCQFLAKGGEGAGRRGVRQRRRCVDNVLGVGTESVAEQRLLRLWMSSGLPRPEAQHPVTDHEGHFVARLDFALPALMIGIEMDSYRHHGDKHSFHRDRLRTLRLTALGWRIIHITPRNLQDSPETILEAIEVEVDAAQGRLRRTAGRDLRRVWMRVA